MKPHFLDSPQPDPTSKENLELRERSGSVNSTNPLVSFIYQLVRDHLPLGVVEHLVRDCPAIPTAFTNGYLARYAMDVAERLTPKENSHDEDANDRKSP